MDVTLDFSPAPVPFSELRVLPCIIPLEALPGQQPVDPRGPIRLVKKRPYDLPVLGFHRESFVRPLPRTPCKGLKVQKKRREGKQLSSHPESRPSTPPPEDNVFVLPKTPGKDLFSVRQPYDVPDDALPPPTPFHHFTPTAGTSIWEPPPFNLSAFSYNAILEALKVPPPISPLPKTPKKRKATWLLAPSAKKSRSDA